MRLTLSEVSAGDVRVEEVKQRQPRPDEVVVQPLALGKAIEADLPQEQVRVLRGGRRGCGDAGSVDCEDEAQRVEVSVELASLDQLDHHPLFVRRVHLDPLVRVG